MLILVLVVFAGFVSFFTERQTDTIETERTRIALAVADTVGFELDLALSQGEGFSRTFQLREDIGGEPYNVTVANGTIKLTYGDDGTVFSSTAAENVTGSVEPGENTVANLGGVINVTQP